MLAFLGAELGFERVTVFDPAGAASDIGSWQTSLCVVTPEAMKRLEYQRTIAALAQRYSPVFKAHFYLISILTGALILSSVPGWLMTLFFTVFGVTAGTYVGTLLYGKRPALSRLIPALIAVVTVYLMYIGELVMMGGVLFRFGAGFLFEPLPGIFFAPVDITVILLSGALTWAILTIISGKTRPTVSD